MSDERVMRLAVEPESAALARRYIRDNATLDTMRFAEADLLVTELVGNVLRHAPTSPAIDLSLEKENSRGLLIRVSHQHPEPLGDPEKGMGLTLLDRLSQRWGHDHDGSVLSVWFVVRTPGTTQISADLPDEALFEQMRDDPAAYSDELVRRHQSLADSIARRYRGKGIDDEDLLQVARMALLKAIQNYDPKMGDIRPYAAATVSGEMKKLLRDRGWSVRVPRSLQERALEVSRAALELGQANGRQPDVKELAAHLDMTVDEVVEAQDARQAYTSKSIDKPADRTGITIGDRIVDLDQRLIGADDRVVIEQAISELPERSRRILAMRFNEDLTQSQIAEELGISQMHVSRLLAAALADLRTIMGD